MKAQDSPSNKYDLSLDALKGLLILLIILGHMPLLWAQAPTLFYGLYSFHVTAFLLLTFTRPSLPNLSKLKQQAVRYIVPFLLFTCFYSLASFLLDPSGSIFQRVSETILALAIASTPTLDAATNLKMLWYLPTLFILVVLKDFFAYLLLKAKLVAVSLLLVSVFVHVSLGEFGAWRFYVPWGLLQALYVLPLGLIVHAYHSQFEEGRVPFKHGVTLCIITLTMLVIATYSEQQFDIGNLDVYSIANTWKFMLQDTILLGSFLVLYWASPLFPAKPILAALGKLSLPIYLIHPIFILIFHKILNKLDLFTPLEILLLFCLVTTATYLTATLLMKCTLAQKVLFPKSSLHFQEGLSLLLPTFIKR